MSANITLILPFIPPTANMAQRNALMGKRVIRYNSPVYNDFKARVVKELGMDNLEAFTAFLASPHKINISIYSPRVLTKKGEISKTFGDVDNFCKNLVDSIYNPLKANDALIMQLTVSKHHADEDLTRIEWEEYTKSDAMQVFPYNPRHDKQKLLHYACMKFMTVRIEHEDLMYLTGDPDCAGILELLDTYGLCPDDEELEAM